MEDAHDDFANTASDPIADLRAACDRIRNSTGSQPRRILIHPEVYDQMRQWFIVNIRRAEKYIRKALLSGRYGKRRRQKAQGVAGYRHEKRERLMRELARMVADLERMPSRDGA